jgi:hypothetical protein
MEMDRRLPANVSAAHPPADDDNNDDDDLARPEPSPKTTPPC